MKLVSTFADRLKEALGDTRASTLADGIGLSKQAISMYTTGKRIPKRPTIKAIAEQLNVSATWLSGYDVPIALIENDKKNGNQLSFQINYHESHVITAYHNQPEMQPAVDKLLSIEKVTDNADENKAIANKATNRPQQTGMYVASRNGKCVYTELPPEEEEARQKLLREEFPELLNPNNEEPPDF